jgi:hypothetical protein
MGMQLVGGGSVYIDKRNLIRYEAHRHEFGEAGGGSEIRFQSSAEV